MSKGLAQIMKQAQMMQQKMARLQEEAAQQTAEATAGGGVVTALEAPLKSFCISLGSFLNGAVIGSKLGM